MGDRWSSIVDQLLGKMFEEIDVTQLPGSGKPLDLKENPHEPAEMRMANKLLKDNDLVPDWILEGKELESMRESLVLRIQKGTQSKKAYALLEEDVKAFNKRVLSFNLKAPAGVAHKRSIHLTA